jgi:hypothetical protein
MEFLIGAGIFSLGVYLKNSDLKSEEINLTMDKISKLPQSEKKTFENPNETQFKTLKMAIDRQNKALDPKKTGIYPIDYSDDNVVNAPIDKNIKFLETPRKSASTQDIYDSFEGEKIKQILANNISGKETRLPDIKAVFDKQENDIFNFPRFQETKEFFDDALQKGISYLKDGELGYKKPKTAFGSELSDLKLDNFNGRILPEKKVSMITRMPEPMLMPDVRKSMDDRTVLSDSKRLNGFVGNRVQTKKAFKNTEMDVETEYFGRGYSNAMKTTKETQESFHGIENDPTKTTIFDTVFAKQPVSQYKFLGQEKRGNGVGKSGNEYQEKLVSSGQSQFETGIDLSSTQKGMSGGNDSRISSVDSLRNNFNSRTISKQRNTGMGGDRDTTQFTFKDRTMETRMPASKNRVQNYSNRDFDSHTLLNHTSKEHFSTSSYQPIPINKVAQSASRQGTATQFHDNTIENILERSGRNRGNTRILENNGTRNERETINSRQATETRHQESNVQNREYTIPDRKNTFENTFNSSIRNQESNVQNREYTIPDRRNTFTNEIVAGKKISGNVRAPLSFTSLTDRV